METKEQQAKEYAEKLPHYQDRKRHAAEDFLAGWDAAESWRTDKEDIPDDAFVLALYISSPMVLSGEYVKSKDLVKYWKPLPKMPEDESAGNEDNKNHKRK